MSDFPEFYQHGGVFMHVLTLLGIATSVLLVRRIGGIRRTFRDPSEQVARLRRREVLTPTFICAMLLCGVLGTSMGLISVTALVPTVDPSRIIAAMMMGGSIALYPLVWSLLLAVPLTIGHGVLRHFEERLRVLIEKHA